jgi:hypothetical protein
MAKKDKTGFVANGETTAQPNSALSSPSTPASQAAKPEAQASTQPATPATQMENAMVQQILERQAVFGF